jgi:opacity protein-like surface antigen
MRKFLPLLMVACSGVAWGQMGEVWFDAGESIVSNASLGTTSATGTVNDFQLTNGFRFGFRADFNTQGFFGHEVQYAYNRTQFQENQPPPVVKQGMAIHEGGYNFLAYGTKEGSRIRPFGTAGVQFENFVPPGASAASGGGNTKYGFNFGGGVKMRITSMFAVRADVREYMSGKPFGADFLHQSGWFRQTEVTAGFGVYF